jgi:DNA-directed RNA polymerase subunit M/transcription elongation factor TFIIS
MQIDPVLEWQRLTAEYREKSAGELLELAREFADLTEAAQQVLRNEMRSRGLGDPESTSSLKQLRPASNQPAQPPLALENAPPACASDDISFGALGAFGARAPELVPDNPEEDEDGAPHDYTWKTPLCVCYTREEAAQLQEALRRASIESWFNFGGYTTSFVPSTSHSVMAGDIQVLVAADQLDQARAIAANPIPPEIVEDSKQETPDFVEPKCPKCGSDDVVLEAVDPENTWRCEQCDEQWTETLPQSADGTPNPANNAS